MRPEFRPGDSVFHFPPDEALALSGPHTIFLLLHTDLDGHNHYLILPDTVLDGVELMNATDYLAMRKGKSN